MMKTICAILIFMLSACAKQNTDIPFPWSKEAFQGKEATYHYAIEEKGEFVYIGYIYINKSGEATYVAKDGEYIGLRTATNVINTKNIYIDIDNYWMARLLGVRVNETELRTEYKKGDPDFQAAINIFLSRRSVPFFTELHGVTRNLNPIFPKDNKNKSPYTFVAFPMVSMYNEYTQKVSSRYIHGLHTRRIPTMTDIDNSKSSLMSPVLVDDIDEWGEKNKKIFRRGKESAYHYAIFDKKLDRVVYIGYFYVYKNGDVTFIRKGKEYPEFTKIANRIDKQKIFINENWYPAAKFLGMRIDTAQEYTYYEKGDPDFQDAVNMYLMRELEAPFLREVGGITQNLSPVFSETQGYGSKEGDIFDYAYDANGKWILGSVYRHGIDTMQLPVTLDKN